MILIRKTYSQTYSALIKQIICLNSVNLQKNYSATVKSYVEVMFNISQLESL